MAKGMLNAKKFLHLLFVKFPVNKWKLEDTKTHRIYRANILGMQMEFEKEFKTKDIELRLQNNMTIHKFHSNDGELICGQLNNIFNKLDAEHVFVRFENDDFTEILEKIESVDKVD